MLLQYQIILLLLFVSDTLPAVGQTLACSGADTCLLWGRHLPAVGQTLACCGVSLWFGGGAKLLFLLLKTAAAAPGVFLSIFLASFLAASSFSLVAADKARSSCRFFLVGGRSGALESMATPEMERLYCCYLRGRQQERLFIYFRNMLNYKTDGDFEFINKKC